MAARGKISAYTIFLVMAIGTIALVSFQGLKERKNLTTLLGAKNKKIDNLSNRFEELLEVTKKTLTQLKKDKESLNHKVKDLESNNMVYHTSCKHDKEKCENEKNKEVKDLREILQARKSEIITKIEKINRLKLDNEHIIKKDVMKSIKNDNLFEKSLEPSRGIVGDKSFENSNLHSVARSNRPNKMGSLVEERNDIGESKNHNDKKNIIDLEENALVATEGNGNGDGTIKDIESDTQLNSIDID